MTSIRCKNVLCDEPIPISEDMEPKLIVCPKCKTEADFEYVVKGQQTMLELPVRYAKTEKIEKLKVNSLIGLDICSHFLGVFGTSSSNFTRKERVS